jgi:hypothetical protein
VKIETFITLVSKLLDALFIENYRQRAEKSLYCVLKLLFGINAVLNLNWPSTFPKGVTESLGG